MLLFVYRIIRPFWGLAGHKGTTIHKKIAGEKAQVKTI